MAGSIVDLKPELMWKHFDEIRKVPHCSRNETALGNYVISRAEEKGVPYKKDDVGNVVIQVPATPGKETAPCVVLQGHLDMVCEKNSDVNFDFDKDALDVIIEGEWVTANGTTLGADNGVGVAAALAVMDDDTLEHGPLELLFTIDEETGLNGAVALEPDFLKGRILINLDSEEEGAFFIGCAGGGDTNITFPLTRLSAIKGTVLNLSLTGLRGGHSGIDIHTGRGNAVQLMASMLYQVGMPFQLIDIGGGSKHNAIPRESFAHVAVAPNQVESFKGKIEELFRGIRFEYKAVEKNIKLSIDEDPKCKKIPMDKTTQQRLLSIIFGIPHGVMAMSQEIDGLVETSNNLAIVKCDPDKATIYTSSRSSIASALESVRQKIQAVAELAGAQVEQLEGYPAWTPNLESKLLATMKKIYTDLNGEEPGVMAIHAGLECGIIGEKYEGMDMISFGPDLRNPHSPDEKVHIESVQRFWELLRATLKALAN